MVRKEGFESSTQEAYQFVMYYADWCGHCQRAKPEFQKLGSKLTIGEKNVKVVSVNAEENQDAMAGKDIKGYPTIHLYCPKGNLVKEYSGDRSKEGFFSFLQKYVR
jgi:thiol-disulfide isomerase/thioredoxin